MYAADKASNATSAGVRATYNLIHYLNYHTQCRSIIPCTRRGIHILGGGKCTHRVCC